MSEPLSSFEKLDRRELGISAHALFVYVLILFLMIGMWLGLELDRWMQFRRFSWVDLPVMICAVVLAFRGVPALYRRLRSR